EQLSAYRHDLDRIAPHLSARLKSRYFQQPIIRSSVDLNMQLKTEAILKNYVEQLYHANINNATAIIIDNKTMQVKAYVGSADYYSDRDGGQVDGIRAIRSPGSTLKPLLYGLAIDEGLITPLSVVADVPVNFSGYQPRNYRENYNGNVTITYALANSLNVPAVKVLHELKPQKLINSLVAADFNQVKKDREFLGLSTVLGGCGATLEELARLYAAFAHDGRMSELNYLHADTIGKEQTVLSEQTNYMISEILTSVTRPDLPAFWKNSENLPKVAWKTGTSYGRRDAWSIGFNKRYTIGVWVGNFSGEGIQELTGADKAAPLLFNIFNSVDRESSKEWFTMPTGVQFRFVCTETGMVPDTFCNNQKLDYFLPGKSDYRTCDHAKPIIISPDSSISYCTSCQPESGYINALYPNLKPELLAFYASEKISFINIPPHNPDCERVFTGDGPRITSPIDKLEYLIDQNDSMQVMLSCHTANNVEKVFWYINDKFYRETAAGEEIYFSPPEGAVKIACSDDKGRYTTIGIDVKKIRF
ncbi:MAG: penicillin-binding transpeptidase domain-containing protein, partial [Cyclobacteriaceae bacterium]